MAILWKSSKVAQLEEEKKRSGGRKEAHLKSLETQVESKQDVEET